MRISDIFNILDDRLSQFEENISSSFHLKEDFEEKVENSFFKALNKLFPTILSKNLNESKFEKAMGLTSGKLNATTLLQLFSGIYAISKKGKISEAGLSKFLNISYSNMFKFLTPLLGKNIGLFAQPIFNFLKQQFIFTAKQHLQTVNKFVNTLEDDVVSHIIDDYDSFMKVLLTGATPLAMLVDPLKGVIKTLYNFTELPIIKQLKKKTINLISLMGTSAYMLFSKSIIGELFRKMFPRGMGLLDVTMYGKHIELMQQRYESFDTLIKTFVSNFAPEMQFAVNAALNMFYTKTNMKSFLEDVVINLPKVLKELKDVLIEFIKSFQNIDLPIPKFHEGMDIGFNTKKPSGIQDVKLLDLLKNAEVYLNPENKEFLALLRSGEVVLTEEQVNSLKQRLMMPISLSEEIVNPMFDRFKKEIDFKPQIERNEKDKSQKLFIESFIDDFIQKFSPIISSIENKQTISQYIVKKLNEYTFGLIEFFKLNEQTAKIIDELLEKIPIKFDRISLLKKINKETLFKIIDPALFKDLGISDEKIQKIIDAINEKIASIDQQIKEDIQSKTSQKIEDVEKKTDVINEKIDNLEETQKETQKEEIKKQENFIKNSLKKFIIGIIPKPIMNLFRTIPSFINGIKNTFSYIRKMFSTFENFKEGIKDFGKKLYKFFTKKDGFIGTLFSMIGGVFNFMTSHPFLLAGLFGLSKVLLPKLWEKLDKIIPKEDRELIVNEIKSFFKNYVIKPIIDSIKEFASQLPSMIWDAIKLNFLRIFGSKENVSNLENQLEEKGMGYAIGTQIISGLGAILGLK